MKEIPHTYAAYADNSTLRKESSSGGIFTLLAETVLNLGGSVYGVKMSGDCLSAEYVRVTDVEELNALKGSKYLQAYVGDTYGQVRKDLDAGIPVLFSGTGCLVNGLKGYLVKDYDNLYCVDVICHGVPSPELWKKYVEYINLKYKSQLISVNFRSKQQGWRNFGITKISDNRKEIYTSKDIDPYMQMFLKNACLRPSCYECIAKRDKRADLSIADFWGIAKVAPEMADGNGTSLVIAGTQKGLDLFKTIFNQIKCKKVSYEDGVRGNSAEYKSVNRPESRLQFYADMNQMSFDQLSRKYASKAFTQVVRVKLRPLKRMATTIVMRLSSQNRRGGVKLNNCFSYGICFTVETKCHD